MNESLELVTLPRLAICRGGSSLAQGDDSMLRQIRLQNFRCFSDHRIIFEPTTVVVGKNNAGKSSLIEALRIVAAVVNRKNANFELSPKWCDLPRFQKGVSVGIGHLGLDLRSVFHRYSDPPATILATFTDGHTVQVLLGPEEKAFATFASTDASITSSSGFRGMGIAPISVLPQIGPLLRDEHYLTDERVTTYLNTRLSSRHFRNQILRMRDAFVDFKMLAEETWPGLRIEPLRQVIVEKGTNLLLDVRDGDFVGEVGLMGHGLQMWLQTIWFLSRTSANHTVVLDEPDVYMHPDLQRKLFRMTSGRFGQTIIASHSVEIMAEADPSNILIIDKRSRRSSFANDEPGVQMLIDKIGGIHNVHLARLWSAKKFLLVEGKDASFLKLLQAKLYPESDTPLDAIPTLQIGGWAGWNYAVGSSMTIRNAGGDQILTYCILDSDFHTKSEIRARKDDAVRRGLFLHIWRRKEIENYLIVPKAIRRVIASRLKGGQPPTEEELKRLILNICEGERHSVEDGLASAIIQEDRRIDVKTANRQARAEVENAWRSERSRQDMVSGKEVLAKLSDWTQRELGVSFGPPSVARAMAANDVPEELAEVIGAIEDGVPFPSSDGP